MDDAVTSPHAKHLVLRETTLISKDNFACLIIFLCFVLCGEPLNTQSSLLDLIFLNKKMDGYTINFSSFSTVNKLFFLP